MDRWGAGVAGGTAVLWYALPDYVSGRRNRALLKTLVASTGGGLYALTLRTPDPVTTTTTGPKGQAERPPADEGAGQLPAWWLRLGTGTHLGIMAAALAVSVGGTIVAERLIHRTGERLARRGVSRPHTRIGLALGALVALSALPARQDPATPNRP